MPPRRAGPNLDPIAVPHVLKEEPRLLLGQTIAYHGSPFSALTLAGSTLVFFGHPRREGIDGAQVEWGFDPVDEDRVAAPEIGRATVGPDGAFRAVLTGTATDVIVVGIRTSGFPLAPQTERSVFGLLGTASPTWRLNDGVPEARILVELPPPAFCSLLEALDLWLVAGRVTTCHAPRQPLQGLKVEAYDRDIVHDDPLGSGVTGSGGNFRIFFRSNEFKAIPVLPPPLDRVPPHELIDGPDVFFRVWRDEALLLAESRCVGWKTGRRNQWRCSHHQLCVPME